MKKQISHKTITRCIATVLSVILFNPWGATRAATQRANDDKGKCDFSLQLQADETLRNSYLNAINQVRSINFGSGGNVESMYNNVIPVRGTGGDLVGIDSFSYECISCHDGMNATYHDVKFKGSGRTRTTDLQEVLGSHPIGMTYEFYLDLREEYKGVGSLHPDMVFIQGRIGCLTCHNPLEKGRFHLVTSNNNSAICLSCHIN
jgi:predicted CXXCH cytochrome family protein